MPRRAPLARRATRSLPVSHKESLRLAALGWDASWAAAFDAAAVVNARGDEPLVPARVIAEHRQRYVIGDAEGDRSAIVSGRFRHEAHDREHLPAVGDWVGISQGSGDGTSVIRAVVPRR